MAEPIGMTAGVLALATFAFQSCKTLHDAVDSYQNHRFTIVELQGELCALTNLLQSIHEQAKPSEQTPRFEHLCDPLNGCARACRDLQLMLEDCTAPSNGGRDNFKAWLNMQFKGKKVVEYKQRIAGYKITLSLALDTIHTRENTVTQEHLTTLTQSIEATHQELEGQIYDLGEAIKSSDESIRDALKAEQKILQGCLKCLEQAKRTAGDAPSIINVERNTVGKNAETLLGTDEKYKKFNLNFSDNMLGEGARAAAGWYDKEVLLEFLRSSRAPDVARDFQAMRAQSSAAESAFVQAWLSTQRGEGLPGSTGSFWLESNQVESAPDFTGLPAVGSVAEDANHVPISLDRPST
ncbi:uncharacterized protein KY384_001775 [Bacidia gigantensis]|uniref:uncharacterized protein n=1 Tax=Bacidia gigantensis TaxID=2732470 RepID=UPI001D048AE4|nr:uncharacterized protein KY384_001775 [Bacidia gigantensis]KAG8532993.1 hypothetical protein KY384_001775 [Bacidia gigantensis]